CSSWEGERAFCRNTWGNIPYCAEIFCCIGDKKPLILKDGVVFCECAPDILSSIKSCSGWKKAD
ncbi:MAG: hypothetical protein J5861_03060, partial [Desulfovibrio sp.]|nr:hypothetical protein [Desulfovibrio sp.]